MGAVFTRSSWFSSLPPPLFFLMSSYSSSSSSSSPPSSQKAISFLLSVAGHLCVQSEAGFPCAHPGKGDSMTVSHTKGSKYVCSHQAVKMGKRRQGVVGERRLKGHICGEWRVVLRRLLAPVASSSWSQPLPTLFCGAKTMRSLLSFSRNRRVRMRMSAGTCPFLFIFFIFF